MKSIYRMIPALLGITVVASFFACDFSKHSGPETLDVEPMVLATYDVPAAYTAEVGSIIRRLLQPGGGDKPGLGSASVAPGGKLLVAATPGIQRGVKELVESLAAKKPVPPAPIGLEIWVVAGRSASADKPSMAPELAPIATALEAVTKTQGSMELQLLEKLFVTSVSGEHARASGAFVRLEETATLLDDKVIADLFIDPQGPAEHSTRLQLTPGKFIVLGQAGYQPTVPGMPFNSERDSSKNMSIYYVVRAEASSP